MNQLLEYPHQVSGELPDPDQEFAQLVNQVNSRFDPLFGIRMPSPNDQDMHLPIMEEAAQAAGYTMPPTIAAPQQPSQRPDLALMQRVLAGLHRLDVSEPAVVPASDPNQEVALVRPYARHIGQVPARNHHQPTPTAFAGRAAMPRHIPDLRPSAPTQSRQTQTHPMPQRQPQALTPRPTGNQAPKTQDPEEDRLDAVFASFMQGHDQAGQRSTERIPGRHRKESRLRRFTSRLGAICMAAAVAIPFAEFIATQAAR